MASSLICVISPTIFLYMSQLVLSTKVILRPDPKLTYVPQNIAVDVTNLDLEMNDIKILHNTSFHLFENITRIAVSFNPIWKIDDGTFDKNLLLREFRCYGCELRVFPASFGPAMGNIKKLQLGKAISDTGIVVSPYFDGFTSLEKLDLYLNPFDDIDSINIPQSVQNLNFNDNALSQFPNVSSSRFPALADLRLGGNEITHISDSALASVSSTLRMLQLYGNKLVEFGDITALNNLGTLWLQRNQLETIPDMLEGVPRLTNFLIKQNTRMACDHRNCWIRLWDRVRSPIPRKDDVKCMVPSAVRGHSLSLINPAFMQCHQGEDNRSSNAKKHDYFKSMYNILMYALYV